jgi:CheY-like chemotaxis protein
MKSILVVEDEQDILFALKQILLAQGYRVAEAANGRDALEWMEHSEMPDLILLDMKMPVMDGWQFAKEFRRRWDHSCPILVMTAAADAEKRAQEIHASGWIGKPFLFSELIESVRQQLTDSS